MNRWAIAMVVFQLGCSSDDQPSSEVPQPAPTPVASPTEVNPSGEPLPQADDLECLQREQANMIQQTIDSPFAKGLRVGFRCKSSESVAIQHLLNGE